jgi:hypothetical protein
MDENTTEEVLCIWIGYTMLELGEGELKGTYFILGLLFLAHHEWSTAIEQLKDDHTHAPDVNSFVISDSVTIKAR